MINKPNVYVMSDLHFDLKELPSNVKEKLKKIKDPLEALAYKIEISRNPKNRYSEKQIQDNVSNVVKLLSDNKENNIFVLAGDFFNDLFQTLNFIEILEEVKVNSFVVLGNHDYWLYSEEKRTWDESITIASDATKDNKYCRLLVTGRKYRIGDLTFIGDSGFTNLNYVDWNREVWEQTATTEELREITSDSNHVKDFEAETVKELNKKWVDFAIQEIEKNSKKKPLFIITHWPMNSEAGSVEDAWWQTEAGFPRTTSLLNPSDCIQNEEKYWLISGHTHRDEHTGNSISVQSGYRNEKWFKELKLSQFGVLIPTEKLYGLIDISNSLSAFSDFSVVKQEDKNYSDVSTKVKNLGYRRAGSSGNKKVLVAYLKNPKNYLKRVKKEISKIKNEFYGNTGYADVLGPQLYRSKLAIKSGIDILEVGYKNNPFEFFTALVVTGYAWNKVTHLMDNMRKVTTYDIIRQSMVYLTIMATPEIKINNIRYIKSFQGRNSSINIGGVEMKIPIINGYHLDLEAFLPMADTFNVQLLGVEKAKEKRLLVEKKLMLTKKNKPKNKVLKTKAIAYPIYPLGTAVEELQNVYAEKRGKSFVYTVEKTVKGIRYRKRFTVLDEAIDYLNKLNQQIISK
ncbi:hypothetical protein FACS1894193_11880 [Bacilli bacterium]|nr:hypothetical protein FACS1894193_11880 [Bacilli bacterium]